MTVIDSTPPQRFEFGIPSIHIYSKDTYQCRRFKSRLPLQQQPRVVVEHDGVPERNTVMILRFRRVMGGTRGISSTLTGVGLVCGPRDSQESNHHSRIPLRQRHNMRERVSANPVPLCGPLDGATDTRKHNHHHHTTRVAVVWRLLPWGKGVVSPCARMWPSRLVGGTRSRRVRVANQGSFH